MTFTDEIREEADRMWEAILDHPMVRELGQGTLDEAPFRYWVRQDYVYLIEYSRLFALGASKASTLDHMGTFADLLESTVTVEMDLHRSYAEEFGIGEAELEATTPSPTTRAYTDFLVRTAALGTFGDTVAALLPCMWGFNETGHAPRCERRVGRRAVRHVDRHVLGRGVHGTHGLVQGTDERRSH